MTPTQLSEPARAELIDTLGDWIDQAMLAEAVIDAIEEECGVPATMDLCRDTWLRLCEGIGRHLGEIANWLASSIDYDAVYEARMREGG